MQNGFINKLQTDCSPENGRECSLTPEFALYSEGKVKVSPVGFLHFDEPPGDVHIKYGFVSGDEYYVLKMASGFYNNPAL